MQRLALALSLFLFAACSEQINSQKTEAALLILGSDAQAAMNEINSAVFPADAPGQPTAAADTLALASVTPDAAKAQPKQDVAPPTAPPPVKYDPALMRIQILLDRAHFSPGVIDGYDGENVRKAVAAYQAAHALPVNGKADEALLEKLLATDSAPALVTYTLTKSDVAGPFAPVPSGLEAMAKRKHLGFARASEAIAEKFHMDEDLLRRLNPGVDFARAGAQIAVAAAGGDLQTEVASIVIDKDELSLRAYDSTGALLAFYPASIGSPEAPAPSGDYAVRAVAFNPTYHYDPKRLPTFGKRDHGALTIPAGPNNPVGDVWIALTLDTYGIHGSPEGQQISKTQSHGCVRLTNWDARELGKAVKAGVPVSFREVGLQAEFGAPRG